MGNRKGRVKLTGVQQQERKNFLLTRLRSGFPRTDVQRQFAEHFSCSTETARIWLNKTCDELIDNDINQRKRTHAVIVEMYHAQVTSYQNEIMAMQKEIDKIANIELERKLLLEQITTGNLITRQLQELKSKLEALPEPRVTDKAFLIEAKSRIRERMFRVISELARIQVRSDRSTEWRDALSVLLQHNLLPGHIAEGILDVINTFESDMDRKIHEVNNHANN
ncbi:MAG: hypothetical protein ICV85_05960 [Tolypothrix sp. T3-bin4]|nr:hypothetical protein [Tolypothrix sp. Co-bin9]MBD0301725.1 hypothetical protein [Tolypothrix sp. T3-bin4]